jgi:hypothetical protein
MLNNRSQRPLLERSGTNDRKYTVFEFSAIAALGTNLRWADRLRAIGIRIIWG